MNQLTCLLLGCFSILLFLKSPSGCLLRVTSFALSRAHPWGSNGVVRVVMGSVNSGRDASRVKPLIMITNWSGARALTGCSCGGARRFEVTRVTAWGDAKTMHPLVGKNVPRRHSDGAGADGTEGQRRCQLTAPMPQPLWEMGRIYRDGKKKEKRREKNKIQWSIILNLTSFHN